MIPQPDRKGLSTLTSLGFHPPIGCQYLSLAKLEARGYIPKGKFSRAQTRVVKDGEWVWKDIKKEPPHDFTG